MDFDSDSKRRSSQWGYVSTSLGAIWDYLAQTIRGVDQGSGCCELRGYSLRLNVPLKDKMSGGAPDKEYTIAHLGGH